MDPLVKPVEDSAVVCVAVKAEKLIRLGTKHDGSHARVCSGDWKTEDNITDEVDQPSEVSDAITFHACWAVDQKCKIYGSSACCWNRKKRNKIVWCILAEKM